MMMMISSISCHDYYLMAVDFKDFKIVSSKYNNTITTMAIIGSDSFVSRSNLSL